MAGAGGSNLTGPLETSAQLQPPHVAHDRRGIECLLHGQREREREEGKSFCVWQLYRGRKKKTVKGRTKCAPAPVNLITALSAGCSYHSAKTLTFHLLLAKFFLI